MPGGRVDSETGGINVDAGSIRVSSSHPGQVERLPPRVATFPAILSWTPVLGYLAVGWHHRFVSTVAAVVGIGARPSDR